LGLVNRTIVALIGTDGAGKTTQARWLADWLTGQGLPAAYWRNAGGRRWLGRLAQRLGRRDAVDLLGADGVLVLEAALRWLAIAQALLRSRLGGRIAVMDRYAYCQYASIRAHGGRSERWARLLYSVFPAPDLVCYLAVPAGEAYRRIEARGTDHESIAHLAALDVAYRGLPEAGRFVVVDGSGTPAQVRAALHRAVAASLTLPADQVDSSEAACRPAAAAATKYQGS